MSREILLKAKNLTKQFKVRRGMIQAVSRVSLEICQGETLALVGESGCGKSTLGRLLLRLLEPDEGTVEIDGTDITKLTKKELRMFRNRMQLVFQDPYSSLDPRMTVRQILAEPLKAFHYSEKEQKEIIRELLDKTGIPAAYINRYPHEFSGGQRQRIGIARALALKPKLIVCDEPVSALDVSIQAQTLNLLKTLQQDLKLTYLFISHDLNVVHYISDRICVMFLGKICELGTTEEIYRHTMHPYTQFLLMATPKIQEEQEEVRLLTGEIPSPVNPPGGCRFHTRCPYMQEICAEQEPELKNYDGHYCACHFPRDQKGVPKQ